MEEEGWGGRCCLSGARRFRRLAGCAYGVLNLWYRVVVLHVSNVFSVIPFFCVPRSVLYIDDGMGVPIW